MSASGASSSACPGSIAPKVPCLLVPKSRSWCDAVESVAVESGRALERAVRGRAGNFRPASFGAAGSGYGSTVAQGWSLFGSVPLAVGTHAGGASLAFGSPPW